jgi:hypothetical protein
LCGSFDILFWRFYQLFQVLSPKHMHRHLAMIMSNLSSQPLILAWYSRKQKNFAFRTLFLACKRMAEETLLILHLV